jgi:S1-C subfamily serine protease
MDDAGQHGGSPDQWTGRPQTGAWVVPPGRAGGDWVPGEAYWVPGPPPKRRHRVRGPLALGAAALIVAGVAAGAGFGHLVWQSPGSSTTALGNASTAPATGGSSGGGTGNGGLGNGGLGNGGLGNGGLGNGGLGNGGSGGGVGPYGQLPGGTGQGGTGQGGTGQSGGSTEGSGGPSNVSAIAGKVSPALVDINTSLGYQGGRAAGTGIVLTSDGEILTNNHVIDGATKISVTDVGNGKTYAATVTGYDKSHDIAVLRLTNAHGLTTAKIGNSSKVSVGQPVVAVGNAGGTGGTPSSAGGSVIALHQTITASDEGGGSSEQLSNVIRINADVEPGDSGGSLVNTSGEVVGIDTAASSSLTAQSSASGSQAFAIPIADATSIAAQIESGQASSSIHIGTTAFLGVTTSAPSDNPYGSGSATSGAQVSGVLAGGAAAQAGLAAGDVITSVNGQPVDSAEALSAAIAAHHPGDKMTVAWTDTTGQSHSATVVLRSGPPA